MSLLAPLWERQAGLLGLPGTKDGGAVPLWDPGQCGVLWGPSARTRGDKEIALGYSPIQALATAYCGQRALSSVVDAGASSQTSASSGSSLPFPRCWESLPAPSYTGNCLWPWETTSPQVQPIPLANVWLRERGCNSEGLFPLASNVDNSKGPSWPPGSPGVSRGLSSHSVTPCIVVDLSLCPAHLPCYSPVSSGTTWQETFFMDFAS